MNESILLQAKSAITNKHHTTFYHKFNKTDIESIQHKLLSWYDSNKRSMPWRIPFSEIHSKNSSRAYQVWISEVMLQQTQVDTVIPYYKKWMETYDSIEKLANADMDDVLKIWAGLGYYSRAKVMLHLNSFGFNGKIEINSRSSIYNE